MAAALQTDRASEYVEKRLLDQLNWYEGAATKARRKYEFLSVAALVSASAVPFFIAIQLPEWTMAASGATGTVLLGLQGLFKFQENWLRYRTAAEGLRREHALFAASAGPYASASADERFAALVGRTERVIDGTHESWLSQLGGGEAEQVKPVVASSGGGFMS